MNAQQGGYKSYFWHFYNPLLYALRSKCTTILLRQFFSADPEKTAIFVFDFLPSTRKHITVTK